MCFNPELWPSAWLQSLGSLIWGPAERRKERAPAADSTGSCFLLCAPLSMTSFLRHFIHARAHTQMLLSVVSEASMQPLRETLREEVSDFHSKLVQGVMKRLEFGCYDSSVSGLWRAQSSTNTHRWADKLTWALPDVLNLLQFNLQTADRGNGSPLTPWVRGRRSRCLDLNFGKMSKPTAVNLKSCVINRMKLNLHVLMFPSCF